MREGRRLASVLVRHGMPAALALVLAAGPAVAQALPPGSLQPQSPFAGSVSVNDPVGPLSLSLKDAIELGLNRNLGVLLSREAIRSARGQRQQDLSELLPNVNLTTSVYLQQLNVAAQDGFSFPGLPSIIGPFSYFDARVYVTQSIFDWQSIQRVRADTKQVEAAAHSYQDARELVVQAVAASYLQITSQAARVDAVQAQRDTAGALHQQAIDQLKAGTTAAIDVLRARVQLQDREQQLIVARNDLAKQKLSLARLIGLAAGQEFTPSEQPAYRSVARISVDEALQRAYASRADYKSLQAQVKSMELERKAAVAGAYPVLSVSVDYGALGKTPASTSGTVGGLAALSVPIFDGGRVRGAVARADAALAESRQQLDNLRGQIDQEVRTALLDLQSAADRVDVARSMVDLAGQTLQQAQDRFMAGVTDNVEVVQAQQSVADASESFIASLYSYNLGALQLARATGRAEAGVQEFGQGR